MCENIFPFFIYLHIVVVVAAAAVGDEVEMKNDFDMAQNNNSA